MLGQAVGQLAGGAVGGGRVVGDPSRGGPGGGEVLVAHLPLEDGDRVGHPLQGPARLHPGDGDGHHPGQQQQEQEAQDDPRGVAHPPARPPARGRRRLGGGLLGVAGHPGTVASARGGPAPRRSRGPVSGRGRRLAPPPHPVPPLSTGVFVSLNGLLDVLRTEPAVRAAVETAREGTSTALDVVAPVGVRPALVAAFAAERPLLVVTATGRECEDLATWLRCYLPADQVAEFPAWETLPHERLSPRSDTVAQRLAVLRRLAHPSPDDPTTGPVRVVVAPVRAVLQPLVKGLADLEPVRLRAGDDAGLDAAVEALAAAAYTRVDMVERRGEFAVRGGILDVFPPPARTPCGWSSSATRSRRSAPSPWPTSAPSRSSPTACGPRRAGSCC